MNASCRIWRRSNGFKEERIILRGEGYSVRNDGIEACFAALGLFKVEGEGDGLRRIGNSGRQALRCVASNLSVDKDPPQAAPTRPALSGKS